MSTQHFRSTTASFDSIRKNKHKRHNISTSGNKQCHWSIYPSHPSRPPTHHMRVVIYLHYRTQDVREKMMESFDSSSLRSTLSNSKKTHSHSMRSMIFMCTDAHTHTQWTSAWIRSNSQSTNRKQKKIAKIFSFAIRHSRQWHGIMIKIVKRRKTSAKLFCIWGTHRRSARGSRGIFCNFIDSYRVFLQFVPLFPGGARICCHFPFGLSPLDISSLFLWNTKE